MIKIKKAPLLFSFLAAVVLSACAGTGIPISSNTKYPIEVLYDNEPLERPYSELAVVEIGSEDSLTDRPDERQKDDVPGK
jgi:hypothetical protein